MLQTRNFHKIIYHADDDEDDRMLFMDAVSELDLAIKVNQAEDGQQLLHSLYQAMSEIPELLFLDINMPGKNGLECLKEIRAGAMPFKALKVIMLSTSKSEYSIDKSYELGTNFYAVKPGTYQELKKLLLDIFSIGWSTLARDKTRFLLT
jgi:DNA-binding NarL/FixJ family response regulator